MILGSSLLVGANVSKSQEKSEVFAQGWAKKGHIQILYHSFVLHYASLNFGRNTTSIALNSNWYNLASMLRCNVF